MFNWHLQMHLVDWSVSNFKLLQLDAVRETCPAVDYQTLNLLRARPAALLVLLCFVRWVFHIPTGLSLIDLFPSNWKNTWKVFCTFSTLLWLITTQWKYSVINQSLPPAELSQPDPKASHLLISLDTGWRPKCSHFSHFPRKITFYLIRVKKMFLYLSSSAHLIQQWILFQPRNIFFPIPSLQQKWIIITCWKKTSACLNDWTPYI